jgi:hypothetical protein
MSRPPFDRLAYREPRPSPALIHALGLVNRFVVLPGIVRLQAIDFPRADIEKLRGAIASRPTFLAPHHPEFMTDWLIDKEISRIVSPLMAHWASYEVVNIHPVAQWVWLRNNLIANAPGGLGKEYSVRWARAGHGVLLHPEGVPSWHGDRVGTLVPGAIDMAWEASAESGAEAMVAPIVWKLHFVGDVTKPLHRAITRVERMLGRSSDEQLPLEQRLASLQGAVLERSLARYGAPRPIPASEFFSIQSAHAERLLAELESRHGATEGDRPRRLHALRRAILAAAKTNPKQARADRRTLAEIERLGHFTSDHYGGATLTQEQIAESVSQIRLALAGRGLREALFGVLPVAVAPRIASIRAPDPLPVQASEGDAAETRAHLLRSLRTRLQEGLDRLQAELEPEIGRYRRPNPFRVEPG